MKQLLTIHGKDYTEIKTDNGTTVFIKREDLKQVSSILARIVQEEESK
jgi:hypothetical protein